MITRLFSRTFAALALAATMPTQSWALTPAAQIVEFNGVVQKQAAGFGSRRRLTSAPQSLAVGQSLSSGEGATALLRLNDRSQVKLGSGSLLLMQVDRPDRTALLLNSGKLVAGVEHRAGRLFQIRTPAAVIEVVGTVFSVEARSQDETVVVVRKGSVCVRARGKDRKLGDEVRVPAGEGVIIGRGMVRGWIMEEPPAKPMSLLEPELSNWVSKTKSAK